MKESGKSEVNDGYAAVLRQGNRDQEGSAECEGMFAAQQ